MDHLERVEVRIRRILGPGGETAVAHTVYCPLRQQSKLLVDCETCERCTEVTPEGSCVVCSVPTPAVKDGPLVKFARKLLPTLLAQTTLGEVMTRDVLCVTADLSVESVSTLLLERGISGVPVVDRMGFPIGIVSKTDLLREQTEAGTVGEIMTPVAFTLEENTPLVDAIKLMTTEGVHRLPVVDQDGRVAGILSTLDVLRWLDA